MSIDQSATIEINRPAAEVFDYVMQVSHDADWRSGIVEAGYSSDGPLGVGTTGFDRIWANGRELVASWTSVEYVPGRLARWTFDSGPLRGSGGYVCEPVADGTRFTLEADVTSTGAFRLLGPIYSLVVRRFNGVDVRRLKSILEAAA